MEKPQRSQKNSELSRIAIERLNSTKNDDEEWSFLFRTKASFEIYYVSHSELDDMQFDPDMGQLDGLQWSQGRWDQLFENETTISTRELVEWRKAVALALSENGECSLAWIVPIWIDVQEPLRLSEVIAGWALFDCGSVSEPTSTPFLEGVYQSPGAAAREVLNKLGVASIPNVLACEL